VKALALDSSGNVYFAGYASREGLPTRTPLQEGFGGSLATGFVGELSADLSTLLFAGQFGDGEYFGVTGLGSARTAASRSPARRITAPSGPTACNQPICRPCGSTGRERRQPARRSARGGETIVIRGGVR